MHTSHSMINPSIAQSPLEGWYETAFEFVKGVYAGKVEMIVDAWCKLEMFMQGMWKELADGKSFIIGAFLQSFQLHFSLDPPGVHPYIWRIQA